MVWENKLRVWELDECGFLEYLFFLKKRNKNTSKKIKENIFKIFILDSQKIDVALIYFHP